MGNLWQVTEDTFDPTLKTIRSQETVFTIGNGYFATRGSFEEDYPRSTPATLLFGVFDAVPVAKEELANAPDWTGIKLFVDGERFRLDRGKLLNYQRTLDLQTGVLTRHIHWESSTGKRIYVTAERFASLTDEHAGIIRYSVTADKEQNQDALDIQLRASFNMAQGNYDLMHWETRDQGHEQDTLWLLSETKRSRVTLAQTMSFSTASTDFRKETVDSDIAPSIRLYGRLAPGATVSTEKLVLLYTSRDNVPDPVEAAMTHHQRLVPPASNTLVYDALLAPSKEAWSQFWSAADIIVEGDDKAQLGIRYNLYQLRINASTHDIRYSIAAKGLTGFGYRGHVFHDTEVFMLPFFTFVLPDISRNLLLYRYNLLAAARKKAANNGYEGAQYPWESTLDGEETTPPSIIHPETGEVIPVLNGFIEIHITSSIAHAFWEYWNQTGDDQFMQDYGAELLLSTALFWSSRAEKNEARGDYEYTNVIGPDEWHEHVNNNAHTNYMARTNLQTALYTLEYLQKTAPARAQELTEKLHLTPSRLSHMYEVAQNIRILQDPATGLFEQFEGFFALSHLDQTHYAGRKDSYQGILGVHEVQKYQIVKQADVLMMMTMRLADFDKQTLQNNWDYYFPITDHDYGSSLTPALHAIIGCEVGDVTNAYNLFMKGALVDLENLRGNSPEGVHAACAGAVWQAVVFGFAGLRIGKEGYTTRASWPANWTRIAFSFKQKGETVHIDLKRPV